MSEVKEPIETKSHAPLSGVSGSDFCMPDNIISKKDHEQYLIDIGITDVVGKVVKIKNGATQRLIEKDMWLIEWRHEIDNQFGEIINDYRKMSFPHYEVRIGRRDIGVICDDVHFH